MKNILITGSEGFLGKNLKLTLSGLKDVKIHTFDRKDDFNKLSQLLDEVDFIFHLAGANRPQNEAEFHTGNAELTEKIVSLLKEKEKKTSIVLCSSVQAELRNPYGISKKKAEDIVFSYAEKLGADVFVFRLPNVFGKWCKPNYNSAVATFCHNIARGLDIQISDPNHIVKLVYVSDVVDGFIDCLNLTKHEPRKICDVKPVYSLSLSQIVALLESFKKNRSDLYVADMSDEFTKKLYGTFLSYLPREEFIFNG